MLPTDIRTYIHIQAMQAHTSERLLLTSLRSQRQAFALLPTTLPSHLFTALLVVGQDVSACAHQNQNVLAENINVSIMQPRTVVRHASATPTHSVFIAWATAAHIHSLTHSACLFVCLFVCFLVGMFVCKQITMMRRGRRARGLLTARECTELCQVAQQRN
jgi:hypothetical protein